jgi:hypothetical protein
MLRGIIKFILILVTIAAGLYYALWPDKPSHSLHGGLLLFLAILLIWD